MPALSPNEKTILTEKAKHRNVFGNLILTDKRLIFEHSSGIISKRVYVTVDLPLEGVTDVSVEGILIKRVVIYAKKGFVSNFPVRLDFSVKEPSIWQEKIISAVKSRMESLETERKKERVQLVLDFAALKEYMIKGGLVLQTIRCPVCNAPLKLPESGAQTKCEYCGNVVLAQDLFERIKSLM